MDRRNTLAQAQRDLSKKGAGLGITEIPSRLARIRAAMKSQRLDALLISQSTNIVYATGFTGLNDAENPHVALITPRRATLFLDSRYFETATTQAQSDEWKTVLARHEVKDRVIQALSKTKATRIGLEDSVGYRVFLGWRRGLGGRQVVATHRLVEEVREVKDSAEIARIKTAQVITDEAFAHLLGFIKAGMTEREVAFELEFTLRRLGAEAMAFSPITAAGANGSMPHAMPSDYRIKKGDLLTMDFGAQFQGYKADMTRTICIGRASTRQREIYDLVLAAQQAGIEAVRGGVKCAAVDAAARLIIQTAGYDDQFGHGTGHGVGLDIHELPSLKPISNGVLQTGSIVTIEPGIYLEGEFGVRIEDMVVVGKDSCLNLTASPKELIEL